jgi:hypothetical protein
MQSGTNLSPVACPETTCPQSQFCTPPRCRSQLTQNARVAFRAIRLMMLVFECFFRLDLEAHVQKPIALTCLEVAVLQEELVTSPR